VPASSAAGFRDRSSPTRDPQKKKSIGHLKYNSKHFLGCVVILTQIQRTWSVEMSTTQLPGCDGPTLEIRLLPSPRPNANAQRVGQFRQGGQDLPGCPFGEKGRCPPFLPTQNGTPIKSNQTTNQSAFQQGNQTTKQPSNHAWQPQNTWKKSAGPLQVAMQQLQCPLPSLVPTA